MDTLLENGWGAGSRLGDREPVAWLSQEAEMLSASPASQGSGHTVMWALSPSELVCQAGVSLRLVRRQNGLDGGRAWLRVASVNSQPQPGLWAVSVTAPLGGGWGGGGGSPTLRGGSHPLFGHPQLVTRHPHAPGRASPFVPSVGPLPGARVRNGAKIEV